MASTRHRRFEFTIENPQQKEYELIGAYRSNPNTKFLTYYEEKKLLKGYCETQQAHTVSAICKKLGARAKVIIATQPSAMSRATYSTPNVPIVVLRKECPQEDPNKCPWVQRTIKNLKCELCKKKECEIKGTKYVPPCPQADPYNCPRYVVGSNKACAACTPLIKNLQREYAIRATEERAKLAGEKETKKQLEEKRVEELPYAFINGYNWCKTCGMRDIDGCQFTCTAKTFSIRLSASQS